MVKSKDVVNKENAQDALHKVYQQERLSFLHSKSSRYNPVPLLDEYDEVEQKSPTS